MLLSAPIKRFYIYKVSSIICQLKNIGAPTSLVIGAPIKSPHLFGKKLKSPLIKSGVLNIVAYRFSKEVSLFLKLLAELLFYGFDLCFDSVFPILAVINSDGS